VDLTLKNQENIGITEDSTRFLAGIYNRHFMLILYGIFHGKTNNMMWEK
jgi:hypothetical protein